MDFVRGLHNVGDRHRGCAVAIGTFDGVHRGHQAMFARLREHAQRLGVPATVLTFEPTPREFLDPAHAPARLTSLREKLVALEREGIGRCVLLRFDKRLRQLRAAQFIDVLTTGLGARAVVVGHDFRFAYRGEADAQVLRASGANKGFEVDVVPPVTVGGERVSSTAVREALAEGELDRAAVLLGRRYSMCGRVVEGEKLGRKLGYATANMRLHRRLAPISGIFAVRVRGVEHPLPNLPPRSRGGDEETWRPGVASLGTRPTVGGSEPLLETHVFDFDGDLYGRLLEVEFVARLRDERTFASLEALVIQMHEDARRARLALKTHLP